MLITCWTCCPMYAEKSKKIKKLVEMYHYAASTGEFSTPRWN